MTGKLLATKRPHLIPIQDSVVTKVLLAGQRAPAHGRGKVLTQTMLMLAGGGSTCADIEHLRVEDRLFGSVASDSTTYRTFRDITPQVRADLHDAFATVRREVWARSSVTRGPVVLDIDASLVQVHSENKAGTAASYKGGFGFHPMFCFADATGEALASVLRPGNATANSVVDHLAVLDAAIAQLPAGVSVGHRAGDDPGLVERPVMVRADSAGCTNGFVAGCRARNVGFAVVARRHSRIHAALLATLVDDKAWHPAFTQAGHPRQGAAVIELTDIVDLAGWPTGTRLIVRREPLHPGAQRSLLESETYRYWGHYTDQPGSPVDLDTTMRAHARRGPHPPPQSLRARTVPVHRPGRQPGVDADRLPRRRPRPLVPAALPHRPPRRRRTQNTPMEALAHPRPRDPQGPDRRHPPPRRLARHHQHPARLHTHQRHHLTPGRAPRAGHESMLRRAPNMTSSTRHHPRPPAPPAAPTRHAPQSTHPPSKHGSDRRHRLLVNHRG
jgi:hypothetical protein